MNDLDLTTLSTQDLSTLVGIKVARIVNAGIEGRDFKNELTELSDVLKELNPDFNTLAFGMGGLLASL